MPSVVEPVEWPSSLQEILLMLSEAGFRDLRVEGGYRGISATPDDGSVVFIGRK